MARARSQQQQQGDVLLRKVRVLPKGAKLIDRRAGRLVLVEGEHAGHAHVIVEDQAELYETMDHQMFLRCWASVNLVHEEHAPQTLVPGIYKIERVREHDYLSGMVGPVQD
jgi:hypothetical protein